jgi:hypothetical protein
LQPALPSLPTGTAARAGPEEIATMIPKNWTVAVAIDPPDDDRPSYRIGDTKGQTLEDAGEYACLIMVAPKLLAALKRLLACPDLQLDELETETCEAIDQATDAIARVQGGADQ